MAFDLNSLPDDPFAVAGGGATGVGGGINLDSLPDDPFSEDSLPDDPFAAAEQAAPQRVPADDPNQKPWGAWDSLKAGLGGVGMGIAGEAIPILKDHITSPMELSGAKPGALQSAARMGSDFGGTIGSAMLGGGMGASAYAGYSTLARNAEDRRIAIEREADQQAMREGTATALPQRVPGAALESWKQTDWGDVGEAALNAGITKAAYSFGGRSGSAMQSAISQGARPLVAAGKNMLKQAGFDAVSSIPSAVVAQANAENMTAEDWADPEKRARVLDPAALAANAAQQAVISAGAQAPGIVGGIQRGMAGREFEVSPQRQAEIEMALSDEVQGLRDYARLRSEARSARDSRAEIDSTLAKAAETRDMLEAERAEVNRAQEEHSLSEARRNIQAALRQAERAVDEAETAFRDNPTMENAEARVAAIDRVNELSRIPNELDLSAPPAQAEPRLSLPEPEGYSASRTAGEHPGVLMPEQPHTYRDVDHEVQLGYVPKMTYSESGFPEYQFSPVEPKQVELPKYQLTSDHRNPSYKVSDSEVEGFLRAMDNDPEPSAFQVNGEQRFNKAWADQYGPTETPHTVPPELPGEPVAAPAQATEAAGAEATGGIAGITGRVLRRGRRKEANPDNEAYMASEYDASPGIMTIKNKRGAEKARAKIEADDGVSVYMLNGERVESAGYKRAKGISPEAAGGEVPSLSMGVSPLRHRRLLREQGPSSPVQQQTAFNPALGQMKTSTLGAGEQGMINASHTDADVLQQGRRVTLKDRSGKMVRPVEQIKSDAQELARTKGAQIVSTWKPGTNYNAEQYGAIEAYTGGLRERLVDLESRVGSRTNPSSREEVFAVHDELFKAQQALIGGKTEAGRALRSMRETFAPVQYDPQTGKPSTANVSKSPNVEPSDRQNAIDYLAKLYGDKPVPESVRRRVSELGKNDIEGLFELLRHQTKVNNKTKPVDAFVNAIRAGMLTGPKTFLRNTGGLIANAAAREADRNIASVVDWAMSKATKQRTVTRLGVGRLARHGKEAVVEGSTDGWNTLKNKQSTAEMRSSLDRYELQREQYTGDAKFNKALDAYVNTTFRAMAAFDIPGRRFAFKNSIIDQAQAAAKTEIAQGAISKADYQARVKEIAAKPSDAMQLEALLQSEKAVFAEKNILSNQFHNAKEGIYKHLEKKGIAGRLGAGSLKVAEAFTVPFLKTPANIGWDVFTRTVTDLPYGIGKAVHVALREAPMTAVEQKKIAEAIGRGGVGVGLALTGYILGLKGIDLFSGTSEQESTGMRETNEVAGKQSGSMTVGGTNMRVQEVGSPVTNIIIGGYSVGREQAKRLENEDSRAGNMSLAALKTLTENPMNKGIERASQITEPGGLQRFVADSAGALVPSAINDTATLFDSVQRDPRKQPGDTFGDVVAKSIQRRLPGLRNRLPARVNALGQPQKEDKWNVIDPTFSRDARWQNDKGVGELVRLDIGLPKPARRKGEAEADFLDRVKTAGDIVKKSIDAIVHSEKYDSLPDELKREQLYKATHGSTINTMIPDVAGKIEAAQKKAELYRR